MDNRLKEMLMKSSKTMSQEINGQITKTSSGNQKLPDPLSTSSSSVSSGNDDISSNDFVTESNIGVKSNNFKEPNISEETIVNSNLPDEIKKAMLENPVTFANAMDTTGFGGLNENDFGDIKRLINNNSIKTNITSNNSGSYVPTEINESIIKEQVENIVESKLDEMFDSISDDIIVEKLYQKFLTENSKIKIGDRLFKLKLVELKPKR